MHLVLDDEQRESIKSWWKKTLEEAQKEAGQNNVGQTGHATDAGEGTGEAAGGGANV